MARTPSTMLELNTVAPQFSLLEPATKSMVTLTDFQGKLLMVVFMCNHCPFVKLIADELKKFADEYAPKGLAVVAINSNDAEHYPDDRPEKMVDEGRARGYNFPYLYDADQTVAKAYRAACTPDFYLFDNEHKLAYRGQFDSARPGNEVEVTGADMRAAVEALLAEEKPAEEQVPSLGCNIKWRPGNEPDYFNI
jgi:thiol-disulfide isomerase/thioredoxin